MLGLLAFVAGWLEERALVLAAGIGFLLAAAVQLGLLAGAAAAFSAVTSTFSLWLGLGVGLIAIGMVPQT